jgi:hypothetical protein
MACGCELRGAPARQNSIYLPGVYASLAGLQGLGVAADGTSAPAAGGLTDEQKAQLRQKLQDVANTQRTQTLADAQRTGAIIGIVTSAVSAILAMPFMAFIDEPARRDIRTALNWVRAIATGAPPPLTTDNDLNVLRAILGFWNQWGGTVTEGLNAYEGTELVKASEPGPNGEAPTGRLPQDKANAFAFGHFVFNVLDRWKDNQQIRDALNPPTPPPPPQPPPSLQAQARQAWRNAMFLRLSVEEGLRRRLDRPLNLIVLVVPDYATAQRIDCSSSNALFVAETAMIGVFGSVPAYSASIPGTTRPRTYIQTPPAASCPVPPGYEPVIGGPEGGTIMIPPPDGGGPIMTPTGGGGGGGGGAGIAVAGAGLLAALMFFGR